MNFLKRVSYVFLLVLSLSSANSCGVSDTAAAESILQELAPLDFFEKAKEMPQAILVDLRPIKQVTKGALWGSINKDYLDPHFEEFLRELDPAVPLLLYSEKGTQSQRVSKLLSKRGFKEVYLLSGGYQAWQAAGF